MDKCSSDAEFDSYWEFEAKNKNRNRIRVGRQYQASIPPLLKPGEKDARKCEDLETLKWKPEQISEQDVDSYLSMAKAVSSFARTIENYRGPEKPPENSLQTAIKGLTEFVTSHHPCHRDAGCKVPVSASSPSSSVSLPSSSTDALSSKPNAPSDWTVPEARLFVKALETCGKNFCAIKKEFLPWKPVRSLIEYYYYFNCKGEKAESPKSPVERYPENSSLCKVEKSEELASSSQDTVTENTDKVENSDTKDEKPLQLMKIECKLQETPIKQEEEERNTLEHEELPLPQPDDLSSTDQESNTTQATVGCLKFFLGGRLVLKLNAQQEGSTGTKCHWVQSHDTPKYSHQSKKMRHRKKSIQDVLPQISCQSPKPKKKYDEESLNNQENLGVKKLKLKLSPSDTFPLLCSSSWTPPVADGRDGVELDDTSSKTSEGYDSPVVIANRGVKMEEMKWCEMSTDIHELKQDKKSWPVTELIPSVSIDHREEYKSHCTSITTEKISPNDSYNHDVTNHKSALTPTKLQVKGSSAPSHIAHSSSPNCKPFSKWSDSSTDLILSERPKCLPCFHSPGSLSCHASPENSSRDFVLDLSSKSEPCKAEESRISQEPCCSMYKNETCTENCSSSEESAHNDNSMCCAKSSTITYYRESTVPVGVETCKSEPPSLASTSQNFECDDKNKTSDGFSECSGRCTCYYNPTTSCSSLKCCKSYSSKEYVCNKEDCSGSSSPNSVMSSSATDSFSKNQQMWFGPPMPPLLQIYPQCYPYYVAYDMSQSASSNPSPTEAPLDLSSSDTGKKENSAVNSISELGIDVPKNATETMDRGMLYQLLKNKVNKQ